MDIIDFRSDTVTWPTPTMREAMATARVGDDVYGEDPTVLELESLAAEKVGKEAAVFVSSGTMGNLVSILAQATRGQGVIVGLDTHAFTEEAGGMTALGGVVPQPIVTDKYGRMGLEDVERSISPDDPHYPRTTMILLENTYGAKNGYPIGEEYFIGMRTIADRHGLSIHLDGARFFNATIALQKPPQQLAQHVDSLSFCLSKGLCAPIGSVVCGSRTFAKEARRARKILGGGMRQAGIIAAAGIVALNEMVDRLAIDHLTACRLAEGLADIPGIVIDSADIKTNIVFFQLEDSIRASADEIARELAEDTGIRIGASGPRLFRALTHYWVGAREVDLLLNGLRLVMATRRNT